MISKEITNASTKKLENVFGLVTEIERYAIHDGPGIRSVVFLKGCPLRCRWCCNPETQQKYIEVAFFEDKCIRCGRCVKACSHGAISVVNGGLIQDRTLCRKFCFGKTELFPCTQQCYAQARHPVGEAMNVIQAYKEVSRDASFYNDSGGGITISGGEPMMQPEFVYALLRYCKENWIDTAIETSGSGIVEDYLAILPYLDVLFIDLKSVDPEKHFHWTGFDNSGTLSIIRNLAVLSEEYPFKMYIRVPVIPGFNNTKEDIDDIGSFVKENSSRIQGVELLPYHKLGRGKYKSLGLDYDLSVLEPPSDECMEKLGEILTDKGLQLFKF